MKKQILYMLCATALLSSCHIYKSYDRPEDITASGLYRDPAADNDTLASDTTNFGNLPWRKVFTDPQLQSLIEAGLKQNTDLLSAAQNVKAAELPDLTPEQMAGVKAIYDKYIRPTVHHLW